MKFVYLLALSLFVPQIAFAQLTGSDFALGDPCASYSQGDTSLSADTDFNFQDVILICDGANWQRMLPTSGVDIERINDVDRDTYVETDRSGWLYEYYDLTSAPNSLAAAGFTLNGGKDNSNVPTATGITTDTNPSIFDSGDDFALKFTNNLTITTAGTYLFSTTSDDGSQLFLDGTRIVNNDGLHGALTITSAGQVLTAGTYTLEAIFFERAGNQVMDIQMSGPDTGNVFINIENYNGGPSDQDIVRFAAGGREIANVLATGAGNSDSILRLLSDTPASNNGVTFNEDGSDSAYVGLGYTSSSLNIDSIDTGDGIIFRQLGTERMRINSSGFVGVNQGLPAYPLDVNGNIRASSIVDRGNAANNINLSLPDRFTFTTDSGRIYFDIDGANNSLEIGNPVGSASPDETVIGNSNLIFVRNNDIDRVGIRNSIPRVKLDVNGSLKLGNGGEACNSTLEGGLRWNSVDSCVEVCDGIAWECSLETGCADDLPDAWLFTNQTNVTSGTVIESDIRLITGTASCLVQINIEGDGNPQYRICSDSSCATVDLSWTSLLGKIQDGKYVQIRSTSSSGGSVQTNVSLRVGARSETWSVTTQGLCSAASPPPGTICPDGSVYLGLAPDGFVKMFSQRCRNPRVWNGTDCEGTVYTMPWNNNYSEVVVSVVGASELFQGQRNTTDLVNADPNTDNFAPYTAANYCNDLGDDGEAEAHGHTDWYLPSQYEADIMCDVIGSDGLNIDWNTIWTSNERSTTTAHYERSDCWTGLGGGTKWGERNVMCIRKESTNGTDTVPDAFSFADITGAALSTVITSAVISISGTDAGTLVSVSGAGSPEISINGRPWATTGTLLASEQIEVRLTSAPTNSTLRSAVIDIGGVTSTWSVTTTP